MSYTEDVLSGVAGWILASCAPGYVRRFGHPSVVIDPKATTAATNGKTIWMPETFMGEKVEGDLANGLLAHEIGHWMQDLDAVSEWKAKEPRNQHTGYTVNILLDIALETYISAASPALSDGFKALNKRVADHNAVNEVYGPFDEAGMLSMELYRTRFRGAPTGHSTYPEIEKLVLESVSWAKLDLMDASVMSAALDRAEAICPLLFKGGKGDGDGDGGSGEGEGDGSGIVLVLPETMGNLPSDVQDELNRKVPFGKLSELSNGKTELVMIPPAQQFPTTARLARRLSPQFKRPNVRAEAVGAGGRIDRRAMARGEMFHKINIDAKKGAGKAQDVVFGVDHSGSMSGDQWELAAQAAEAVWASIKQADPSNNAHLFVFHDRLYRNASTQSNGILHDLNAIGWGGTSFDWLVEMWREFPRETIIVVTDGGAPAPRNVSAADKARTCVIEIGSAWGSSAHQFSDRVQNITNLEELPNAMAALIPRGAYYAG